MSKILFGPYGTRLDEVGCSSDPMAVLEDGRSRAAVAQVAEEYLHAGAEVATVNGFGLRWMLHKPGERKTYFEALRGQNEALVEVLNGNADAVRKVLSVGPSGECYEPEQAPGRVEAAEFHEDQVEAARVLHVDKIWFETLNTIEEAIGVARAAGKHAVPCVVSFVLNKRGELLSGEDVAESIRAVDLESGHGPLGYSFNCCPIEALEPALRRCEKVLDRVVAVYPNASSQSPEELSGLSRETGEVARNGNRSDTARYLAYLARKYHLSIVGGCCGYDHRDIGLIHAAVQQGLYSIQLPDRGV